MGTFLVAASPVALVHNRIARNVLEALHRYRFANKVGPTDLGGERCPRRYIAVQTLVIILAFTFAL